MDKEIIKGVTLTADAVNYLKQCFEACIIHYMEKHFFTPWYGEVNMFYLKSVEDCRKQIEKLQKSSFISDNDAYYYAFIVGMYGKDCPMKHSLKKMLESF